MDEAKFRSIGRHLATYAPSAGDEADLWAFAWGVAALPDPVDRDALWLPARGEACWLAADHVVRVCANAEAQQPAVRIDVRVLDNGKWIVGIDATYERPEAGHQQVYVRRWEFDYDGQAFLSVEGRLSYDGVDEWEGDPAELWARRFAERVGWPALAREVRG